jgi:hypothetical protein
MKFNRNLDESLEAIIQELTDAEFEQVSGGIAPGGCVNEPGYKFPGINFPSNFLDVDKIQADIIKSFTPNTEKQTSGGALVQID